MLINSGRNAFFRGGESIGQFSFISIKIQKSNDTKIVKNHKHWMEEMQQKAKAWYLLHPLTKKQDSMKQDNTIQYKTRQDTTRQGMTQKRKSKWTLSLFPSMLSCSFTSHDYKSPECNTQRYELLTMLEVSRSVVQISSSIFLEHQ